MTVKKQTINKNTSDKKAAVLGEEKKKNILPYIITVCVLVVVGAVFFSFSSKEEQQPSDYAQSGNASQVVTHAVDLFADGQARHFQYDAGNNILVKYFVLKSSDGVLRAAFDACDVCWPSGKGYYQEGDHMVCRNCGRRFISTKVNEVKGGCNPAPLERKVVGDNLVIEAVNILEGRRYFDFDKRRKG